MDEVHLAEHARLESSIALKLLSGDLNRGAARAVF